MPTTQIEKYHVIYSANTFRRRIGLMAGGAYIGQLVFHANGAALPADGLNGTQPQLNYHLDDFQNCIDLLRVADERLYKAKQQGRNRLVSS